MISCKKHCEEGVCPFLDSEYRFEEMNTEFKNGHFSKRQDRLFVGGGKVLCKDQFHFRVQKASMK